MTKLLRRITREHVTFAIGATGLAWETLFEKGERPTLVMVFGALLGLPVWTKVDRAAAAKRQERKDDA